MEETLQSIKRRMYVFLLAYCFVRHPDLFTTLLAVHNQSRSTKDPTGWRVHAPNNDNKPDVPQKQAGRGVYRVTWCSLVCPCRSSAGVRRLGADNMISMWMGIGKSTIRLPWPNAQSKEACIRTNVPWLANRWRLLRATLGAKHVFHHHRIRTICGIGQYAKKRPELARVLAMVGTTKGALCGDHPLQACDW